MNENFSKEITADGSQSFFNKQFQESYHSRHGAYTEALEKHVQACQIPRLAAENTELKILDLCFGLGYNSAVAIAEALKVNPDLQIEITALESDLEIVQEIAKLEVPDDLSSVMQSLAKVTEQEAQMILAFPCFSLQEENFSIDLLIGDAQVSIMCLEDDYYDAIFFDPFSPKVCPELWQPDFIKQVVSKSKPGALISTYSSARIAKDGFAAAGCEVGEGPKCGRRDGGVLARRAL